MTLGNTIKRLRHEQNLTQDQLAKSLSITSRAVSQWECDRTTPDLSLIPSLCHIFGITSDELLGIDVDKSRQMIERYLEDALKLGNQNKLSARTKLLREANRKFPREYRIMLSLSESILAEYSRKSDKNYDEVIELCKRILAECTDSNIRYNAMSLLATAYSQAETYDEMFKLALEMPRVAYTYEEFMIDHWSYEFCYDEMQDYLNHMIERIIQMTVSTANQYNRNGELVYTPNERIHLLKTVMYLLEFLFPDEDYHIKALAGETACSYLADIYFDNQNYEEAWHWIEKGAEFAIHMDTYDFDAPHTSLILRGYVDGGWIKDEVDNHTQKLLDMLTSSEAAEIWGSDARYHALVERLEEVAQG